MPVATREVFGNIQPWMQGVFYGLMLLSIGALVWQIVQRVRLWRKGEPGGFERDWRIWVKRLAVYALGQKRVWRRSLGATAHLLLFSGFVVLTIGTTLLMFAHAGPIDFHHGWYYLIYELTMDVFGVAFCIGCAMALYRRLFRRAPSLGHDNRDWLLLSLLLAIGVSGFVLEGLRIRYAQPAVEHARWSVVGAAIGGVVFGQVDRGVAEKLHLAVWWLHAVLVAGLFAAIPVTRMLHAITGPLNIALRPSRPMGALEPISLEQVEQTGRIGAGAIEHLTQQQLLSVDACMQCGRCEDACPAYATGKPLSPKQVVIDLQGLMSRGKGELHDETIAADTLWACTMCQACVYECPVLIGHVDLIAEMRRHLVGEGQIAGAPAVAMRHMGSQANPYGRPASERMEWADGLDVPTVEENPDFEYLLWVGCAAAFDPRAQKVARATVQLLLDAAVNFAVLAQHERCTGDPARRIGDEFLFQELAQQNVETLNEHKVRKIVTPCPHCFNTLSNEYRPFGGTYEVMHHSQLLAELIDQGRLTPPANSATKMTLHDPCYLARVNGESDAQRKVIGANGRNRNGGFRELSQHGDRTFCCGAGGGRMWFDDESPDQRVSSVRARHVAESGAEVLATACPFCLNMMSDAVAASNDTVAVKVLDIAEVLVNGGAQAPAPST